jgi:hypothetical protein
VSRQHVAGHALRVRGEVGPADALLLDEVDPGVVLLDRLLEGVVALAGDEEVRVVEDDAHGAAAVEPFGHQVRGRHAVAEVVGRRDAHVVVAVLHTRRDVVHEDELHALRGRTLVRARGRHGIRGDRDDDVGLVGEHGRQVGDLPLDVEAGVGDGDDVDAHLGELRPQAGDLRPRPVVAAVVHDDRRGGVHRPDLPELLVAEPEADRRRRGLAVRSRAENLVLAERAEQLEGGTHRAMPAEPARRQG